MKLLAEKRVVIGKKVKNLRKDGVVPAAVYGPKRVSTNIQIDKKDFIKLFKEVGYNKFFDLEISLENPAKVLIKDIQVHPISYQVKSVSFYQVDEDRKITVQIPVRFIGESPAVKQNLGFLIPQLDTIAIHCLPKDLPNELVVDISTLEKPGDAVSVGQIKLSENQELDSAMDKTTAIVYIGSAQKEVEEVKPATEVAAATETTAAQPTAPVKETKK